MLSVDTSFLWPVAVGGYRLEGDQIVPAEAEPAWRRYRPFLDEPAMFLELAGVRTITDSLAFCSRFGPLNDPTFDHLCCPVKGFQDAARDLRGIVQISRAVRDGDPDLALKLIEEIRGVPAGLAALPSRSPQTDLLAAGAFVSDYLSGHGLLAVAYDPSGSWTATYRATSLLSAAWLQAAGSIVFDQNFIACALCGKLFPATSWAENFDRSYCSVACRSKAYRDRKATALQMAADGKKPKQIADALGAKLEAVRGWLKATKGKRK